MNQNCTKDGRELITFEKTLGTYSAAGAVCSYGDVIDFVDGDKKGIIIADTCGHVKECGDKAGEFLRKEIEKGWGSSNDAYAEILDLGRRLMIAGHGKPYLKRSTENEWWDCIEFGYAHLDGNLVSLSGLRHLIYRSNGDIEQLDSTLGPYHFEDPKSRKIINTRLDGIDVMLMSSDGLVSNTAKSLLIEAKSGKISLDVKKTCHEHVSSLFAGLIDKIKEKPVGEIRDDFVDEFGKYFLPRTERYDDVTLALIKRTP